MAGSKIAKLEFLKKYFTIREAENLLPRIEKILRRVVKLNKALDLLSSIEVEVYDDDYENLRKVIRMNGQFHRLSYEFYSGIESIQDMGCIVRDYDSGIIDFYSRFWGRDIFLCWKLGENSIRFWHKADASCMERKPILDLTGNK